MTGQDDAKATLEELDRSNLFLVPLDDRRTWYRYHHLFGDVLRARLLDEQPDRVAELHRRASDWYAANGDLKKPSSTPSPGRPRARRGADRAGCAGDAAGAPGVAAAQLARSPSRRPLPRPAGARHGARRCPHGDRRPDALDPLLEIVDSWLDRADDPIVFDEDAYRRLPAMAAVHRAGLALLAGDTDGTIEHAGRVLELVGPDDQLQRGAAAALLGLAHWSRGDLDGARDRYVESIACFEPATTSPT